MKSKSSVPWIKSRYGISAYSRPWMVLTSQRIVKSTFVLTGRVEPSASANWITPGWKLPQLLQQAPPPHTPISAARVKHFAMSLLMDNGCSTVCAML